VPPFYDSLLGKVVVWGPDRPAALARARRALRELEVDGIETNRSFLAVLLDQEWFARGEFNTGTLETWLEEFAAQNGAR